MGRALDLLNCRFGRLTVIERHFDEKEHSGKSSKRKWLCKCDCGNYVVTSTQNLRKGDSRSCGCLKAELTRERMTEHGHSKERIYKIWKAMRKRCGNTRSSDYSRYGGRGISVCSEWQNDFSAFRSWAMENGYSDELSIDRIDVNGNYEPCNCRWISQKAQSNNRRTNVLIEYDGKSQNIQQWADEIGMPYGTLYNRLIIYKWPAERAITTPIRSY